MLKIYSLDTPSPQVWQPGAETISNPTWIDLINPSDEEREHAAGLLGTKLPARDETSAIELSSRFSSANSVLRLNIPLFVRSDGTKGPMTPLGFVLTPTMLASVRYAESISFNQVGAAMSGADAPHSGTDVFIALMEGIVDVAADRLEDLGNRLSNLSEQVFTDSREARSKLRRALLEVGSMQRQVTQIRSAMLGVSRVIIYLCDSAPAWIDSQLHGRFRAIQGDISSLSEFQQQLNDRLQFMLDAVLGFINNDQNDIMKVLTIVSVVTVPPMILAGIWGMNFKSIPEYDWPHGYAFALSMIVLSMLIPVIWFKSKKWL
jgi:magnesium transporter